MKSSDVAKGVTDSVDFWLSQHEITAPECIVEGVEKALSKWLDANKEEIIEAIAKRIATKPSNAHGN